MASVASNSLRAYGCGPQPGRRTQGRAELRHALALGHPSRSRVPRSSTAVVRAAPHRAFTVCAAASSSSGANTKGPVAWKGEPLTHGSLPMRPDGTVDYSAIDRNPISLVLISRIRGLLVKEAGDDRDSRPWTDFDGLMTVVRDVNDMEGTAADVQQRARRVFEGILPSLGIGWVPPLWRRFVAGKVPDWAAHYAFVLVFTTLFPWLMGPMEGVDEVEVDLPPALARLATLLNLPTTLKVPQAVKAERCRFVESTACASVCVNSCKVPSQEWLTADFGVPLHIQPNYDDFSCQWKFGVPAPPLEEDEAVMVPCFSNCPSEQKGAKDALRQRLRARKGVGIVDGVDTYTGDTLEDIAARASAAALRDAAGGLTPMGSALTPVSLDDRLDEMTGGGKCWSVDERRESLLQDTKRAENTA